jgi:hypothetical protein
VQGTRRQLRRLEDGGAERPRTRAVTRGFDEVAGLGGRLPRSSESETDDSPFMSVSSHFFWETGFGQGRGPARRFCRSWELNSAHILRSVQRGRFWDSLFCLWVAMASPNGLAMVRGVLVRPAFFADADMYHGGQMA